MAKFDLHKAAYIEILNKESTVGLLNFYIKSRQEVKNKAGQSRNWTNPVEASVHSFFAKVSKGKKDVNFGYSLAQKEAAANALINAINNLPRDATTGYPIFNAYAGRLDRHHVGALTQGHLGRLVSLMSKHPGCEYVAEIMSQAKKEQAAHSFGTKAKAKASAVASTAAKPFVAFGMFCNRARKAIAKKLPSLPSRRPGRGYEAL